MSDAILNRRYLMTRVTGDKLLQLKATNRFKLIIYRLVVCCNNVKNLIILRNVSSAIAACINTTTERVFISFKPSPRCSLMDDLDRLQKLAEALSGEVRTYNC